MLLNGMGECLAHRNSIGYHGTAAFRRLLAVPAKSAANVGFLALARTGGAIPEIEYRGALWFAVVGLCNGLAVLAMYAALEFGPVAVVSPLIAGYPLVTLLLSRAFLEKEAVGRQLITGVIAAVCGVVLLLVA